MGRAQMRYMYVSLKALVKLSNCISRMKNAAMMVWTSVVVSSVLIFTNIQIRLFEYAS